MDWVLINARGRVRFTVRFRVRVWAGANSRLVLVLGLG